MVGAPVVEETRKGDDAAATLLKTAQAKIDARLLDQAVEDLKKTVATYSTSATAPAAQLLIGQVYEKQNRPDDAQAAYVELRSHYGSSPAAADATYQLAELVAKGKRDDRDAAARRSRRAVRAHPKAARALHALSAKAVLEDGPSCVAGPELQASVPASLSRIGSWCGITRPARPPKPPEHLSERYKDAAVPPGGRVAEQLATRFPANRRDAARRAAERMTTRSRTKPSPRGLRSSPPLPPRYRDAQKKLR